MKYNIEQKRLVAMEKYNQFVQNILENVIKVAPDSANMAFAVLDCRANQNTMAIFYRQNNWVNGQELINAKDLLVQGPQIIHYIAELFEDVDMAEYVFIQLRYNYDTNEWHSHFVWQDEYLQPSILLHQFVTNWQVRMETDINQW